MFRILGEIWRQASTTGTETDESLIMARRRRCNGQSDDITPGQLAQMLTGTPANGADVPGRLVRWWQAKTGQVLPWWCGVADTRSLARTGLAARGTAGRSSELDSDFGALLLLPYHPGTYELVPSTRVRQETLSVRLLTAQAQASNEDWRRGSCSTAVIILEQRKLTVKGRQGRQLLNESSGRCQKQDALTIKDKSMQSAFSSQRNAAVFALRSKARI